MPSLPSALADDRRWILAGLRAARDGVGNTAPNPSVAALIVADEGLLIEERTGQGGRPHAETQALQRWAELAPRLPLATRQAATLYVTLEPCNHFGKTPPCTEAIIQSGIRRVVVGMVDPDPRVAGQGIARLEAAGISVISGVADQEVKQFYLAYSHQRLNRSPYLALKLATSLDSRLALANGQSQWITGEEARHHTHGLRRRHDGILIGAGTLNQDKPRLTCRLAGFARGEAVGEGRGIGQPQPIIIAGSQSLSLESLEVLWQSHPKILIIATSLHPQWAWLKQESDQGQRLKLLTIDSAPPPSPSSWPDLSCLLPALADLGFIQILIEGGGRLAGTLLGQDLVNEIHLYQAGLWLGTDSLAAVASPFNFTELQQVRRWQLVTPPRLLGRDCYSHWRPIPKG